MNDNELRNAAVDMMKNAYAPYSDFFVGAALLGKSGKVYLGSNVENASFTAGCCAERTALFAAVASGEREFSALAIAGGKHGELTNACPPCGVCRQALSEFCKPDMPVILATKDGFIKMTFGELLPMSFELNT